ncbi:CbaC protein [Natrinema sp. HArc-T2]|uniref:CbaC protein n=1 Tax=Natrinema sp. HArc-T2 TaxID=3242701 RepID=UPI00359DA338
MRISKGGLLVIMAFLTPLIVELRTVLSWFGIKLSVGGTVALSGALVLAVLVWALWPPNGDTEVEPAG